MPLDVSKLSDEELNAAIGSKLSKQPSGPDLSKLSDEELDSKIQAKISGPSTMDSVMRAVGEVGKAVDTYTGAPARAALSELTRTTPEFNKDKPSFFGNIVNAAKAGYDQFGADPSLAPTGKDIATSRLGLSDKPLATNIPTFKFSNEIPQDELAKLKAAGIKPDALGRYQMGSTEGFSPAGMAGLGIDIAADPLNLVPVGTVLRGTGKLAGVAGDIAGGLAKKIPGVKATAEATGKIIDDFVKPSVAKDFGKLQETAAIHGIDLSKAPEAIEFGKDSMISRGSRSQAEGPGGQARLEKHREFLGDVSQAFDKNVADISQGAPLSRADAGIHLKDSYDRSVAELFNKADVRYSTITKDYPALSLSEQAIEALTKTVNGVEKYAKGLVGRGIRDQRAMGEELLDITSALRQNRPSFKQMNEFRDALGRKAFQTGNSLGQVPSDISKMRDLYGALTDALQETVRTDIQGGEALAGALKIDNQLISDFMAQKKAIADILGNTRLAPEQVFDRLTRNSSQIRALKELLAPEDFAKLKGAYLEGMVKRDDFGNIQFAQLKTALQNRQNREVVKQLFEPEEAAALFDLADLGDRAGIAILSTSGTGASNFFRDIGKGMQNTIINEGAIDLMKSAARKRALALPKESAASSKPLFGPAAISKKEAFGLRLPQQISIQQRNKDKR